VAVYPPKVPKTCKKDLLLTLPVNFDGISHTYASRACLTQMFPILPLLSVPLTPSHTLFFFSSLKSDKKTLNTTNPLSLPLQYPQEEQVADRGPVVPWSPIVLNQPIASTHSEASCNTPSPLRLGLSLFFFYNKIFAKIHKVYQST
jgi:hypothetical protein